LNRAETVAVQDFAFEQISHCRKADMRVRPRVETAPGFRKVGPISSKKTKGPTEWRYIADNARRNSKPPPRSRLRGTRTVSMSESAICRTCTLSRYEMRDPRFPFQIKSISLALFDPIGVGHALVLSEMLEPRFDIERFD
jgi:hypothetical protein